MGVARVRRYTTSTGFFRCGHTLWGLRLPLTITTTCDLLSADELETMATGDVYDIIHSVHKETIPLLRVGHFGMGAGDLSLFTCGGFFGPACTFTYNVLWSIQLVSFFTHSVRFVPEDCVTFILKEAVQQLPSTAT